MVKGWVIFKHELYTVFARPSFWIAVLFLPVLSLCLYGGDYWIASTQSVGNSNVTQQLEELVNPKLDYRPQGYVDQAGVLRLTPPGFHKENLLAYPDEPSARQALYAGKISAYFFITADYLNTGLIFYNFEELNPAVALRSNLQFKTLLNYNLLDGNREAVEWVSEPVTEIRENNLSKHQPQLLVDPQGGQNRQAMMLPYLMESFIAIEIIAVSGLLLTALNRDQENRTLEILLTSSDAYPFLLAKMGALGLAGLVQLTTWGVNGLFLAQWSGQALSMPELLNLSPAVLIWALALSIAGYLFYGALMISIGVLVSGMRDYSTVASIIALPMLLPIGLIYTIFKDPDGVIASLLSFIPFTSPSAMTARMMVVHVPGWQLALALGLLVLSALVGLRITANLFQAQRLMGGSKFYIANWFHWLKKRKAVAVEEE